MSEKIEAKAEYEIRDGKRFLNIKGSFVEVDLYRISKSGRKDENGSFMQVLPVHQ